MPGLRNPVSMSNILEHIHDVVEKAKSNAHDVTSVTKSLAEEKMLKFSHSDLVIQFIGASGLPKMDVVGSADPYFVANIDHKLSFVSNVKSDTLAPVFNEIWKVKNVPSNATLSVKVMDKDEGPTDDYIGRFQTTVSPGTKEAEIEGPVLKRTRGTFWLKIESSPSEKGEPEHPYLFDGPVRYSRHNSPTVGFLTNINDQRLYSTWKMYLRGVPLFFGERTQHWNINYKAAQDIFQGPASIAVRSGIQAGHRMLYARTTANGFGIIESKQDVYSILWGGPKLTADGSSSNHQFAHRVKPAIYTYIIAVSDDSFRFSETGAAFFVDFASKHALHSNCAEAVRYSGEFHPRPAGGWDNFSDDIPDDRVDWELVIDNNSGTYSPDPALLPAVKDLLMYNFPGFEIHALSHEDPELAKSREACRAYALNHRGVRQDELQPHTKEGEETLCHQASVRPPVDMEKVAG